VRLEIVADHREYYDRYSMKKVEMPSGGRHEEEILLFEGAL
jgi:hypothetical protein